MSRTKSGQLAFTPKRVQLLGPHRPRFVREEHGNAVTNGVGQGARNAGELLLIVDELKRRLADGAHQNGQKVAIEHVEVVPCVSKGVC